MKEGGAERSPSYGSTTIAVLLGVGVGLAGAGLLEARPEPAPERKLHIAIAARDLPAGARITEETLDSVPLRSSFVGTYMVQSQDAEEVSGRFTTRALAAGEPLVRHALQEADPDPMVSRIPRTLRAVPVRLPGAGPGLIRPGHRVDVIATVPHPDTGERITERLLENILVHAVDGQGDEGDAAALGASEHHVTQVWLLVLPEEAELVMEAQKVGRIHLVLRNPRNRGIAARRRRMGTADLLDFEKAMSDAEVRLKIIERQRRE